MARTSPYYTTYKTQRFSLVGSPQQRDGLTTKDQRFINLYPELIQSDITQGKKYYLKKRPGLLLSNNFNTTLEGRGIYYWQGNTFVVLGNTVFRNGVSIFTLTTFTGRVGFTEYKGTNSYLILLDGVQGWTIDTGGTPVRITDVNFPTPHIPTPVFLDGYLLVAKSGTADIFNSNLNDPFTWNSSQFITAEQYPDNLTAIVRNANYVVAVGTNSVEFFFDADIATGSPLQTNPSAVQQMGSPATFSVVQTDREVILVGQSGSGGHTVWLLADFKATQIALEPVAEALDDEGAAIANCTAFVIHSSGHKWYVLNLVNKGRTFVYDFYEKMWHEWQTNGTTFTCQCATESGLGSPLMLGKNTGKTYLFDSDIFTDDGVAITCQATTVKIDFDTIKRKFFYRFTLVGDSPNGANNVSVSIDWSDDDYDTFQPNPARTLFFNDQMPAITRMGYGRRRVYRITYNQPYEFRMEAFELDVNIGET